MNKFTPDQIRQILAEGNSESYTEFVGVRCLHSLSGGVMSFETYIAHRLGGCQPHKVADNFEDLSSRRPHNPLDYL